MTCLLPFACQISILKSLWLTTGCYEISDYDNELVSPVLFSPSAFPPTMASADFSWFVVTAHTLHGVLRLAFASMRPPGVRRVSFPPYICRIYIPLFLPAKLSGLCCLAHSPYIGMPDAIRVPQTGGLPTPSFGFHLTMDTLGVRLVVGVGRLRPHSGLSPPRYVPCPAHQNETLNDFRISSKVSYLFPTWLRICYPFLTAR